MPSLFDVPSPKGPYGPPDVSEQLQKFLGGLPENYFKGTQMRRQLELQKPILGPDGQPTTDIGAISTELLKRGGGEYAKDLLPFLWKQQFLNEDAGNVGTSPYGGGGTQPRVGAPAEPPGQKASILSAAAGQPSRQAAESGPAFESTRDAGQADTVRNLATERGINVSTPGFEEAFGASGLDRELTPEQAAGAVKKIDMLRQSGMFGPVGGQASLSSGPLGGRGDDAGSTATTANETAPIVPRRVQTVQAPSMAGQPGMREQMPSGAPGQPPSGATGMVPPGVDPRAYAQRLKEAADAERTRARREAIAGIPSKAREDKAAAYDKTSDEILKQIGEAEKQTRQQQLDIAKSDAEKYREAQQKQATDREVAVNKSNQTALEAKDRIGMMRSLTNQPGFNSGVYSHVIDTLNGIGARLFNLPNLGTSGQFFDKLRAGSVLNEIRSLGGSGAGPVRVAEMKFIDTLQASRDMQPGSIRSALETENRLHERAQEIFRLKQEYLKTHRELDSGFLDKVNGLWEREPLFSKAEMVHPDLLGMPIFESEAQMRASRMPGGTQFRTGPGPNAKIRTVPAGNERGMAPAQPTGVGPGDRT
jgi:hypothetical protein